MTDSRGGLPRLCERHFLLAAAIILCLTALNVGARLDREIVTDWDEALYAITAWESLQSGDWIGTTFLGKLDYYNSKPPLNVWLIGLAFKAFGPSLLSLRLVSALSAWLTVLVVIVWGRRQFGATVALLAGVVLSTSFGFMYVHSARSGNADALFTLLVLLLVVVLCGERQHPWRRMWLGPIAAALFLLKGMAVLMPLTIVALVLVLRPVRSGMRLPSFAAIALFLAPCAAWALSRWQVDGSTFLYSMWRNDLIRISTEVLEGHGGTPLFYLDVLQKNQYEWLLAAAVAYALFPVSWSRLRELAATRASDRAVVLIAWASVCLLIPTAMRTKLPWYLNPFYPIFALGTAWLLARSLAQYDGVLRRRRIVLATMVVALCAAEAKLVWYSFQFRDVDQSIQGLLMAESTRVARTRVFRDQWSPADLFVLHALVSAEDDVASGVEDFLRKSRPGDFLVDRPGLERQGLEPVRSLGTHALYERTVTSVIDEGGLAAPSVSQTGTQTSPPLDRAARGS